MIKYFWIKKEGQAMTEAALVLPILLLIIMAALTFGMLIYAKTLVVLSSSQAARVGASIYNDDMLSMTEKELKIKNTANYFLSNGISGTDSSNVHISISADGGYMTVEVTYNYKLIFPLLGDIERLRGVTNIPIKYESRYLIQ